MNAIKIKFEKKYDSFSSGLGVSEKRHKEMQTAWKKLDKKEFKDQLQELEASLDIMKPQTQNELVLATLLVSKYMEIRNNPLAAMGAMMK